MTASYRTLGDFFSQPCTPTPVQRPQLIAFNQALAETLQLPAEFLAEETALTLFAGNTVYSEFAPFCQAYAGHQFGHFNPRLGDGRALTILETLDQQGVLRDVQLKGAGRTPFSRGGDGRSPLGPVLREFIMCEAMHALGVPTTRALAAIATGEYVQRERAEPGAVLTRVASSHIRVGSFQFAAAHGGPEQVKLLADYVIARHYPECAAQPQPYLGLLEAVIARQATLVAQWMSFGFIHGVMNTDNTSICGETIDYGPCAMLDSYQPEQFYSFIDKRGRYRYSQQPRIAQWNLARFAECLAPLMPTTKAADDISAALEHFTTLYEKAWLERFSAKLGIVQPTPFDRELINQVLVHFQQQQIDFTLGFRALADSAEPASSANEFAPEQRLPSALRQQWLDRLARQQEDFSVTAARMNTVNPVVIPRNHHLQAVIQVAQAEGDLRPFHYLLRAATQPFNSEQKNSPWAKAPKAEQEISNTFCGT
ncbi:protein adenylyltransferase SelO [Aliidiomarina celeris]|uniref:protein adenylyltransferase SelO n=1 Tax=Aliidiomarina celeris TaxID=2249428 RepID=UPI000DEBAA70|nr:YdiU family protein [Aliidiomarina celeris]